MDDLVGSAETFQGPEPRLGIPKSIRKQIIDQWLKTEPWFSYSGEVPMKRFRTNLSAEQSRKLINLKRTKISKGGWCFD